MEQKFTTAVGNDGIGVSDNSLTLQQEKVKAKKAFSRIALVTLLILLGITAIASFMTGFLNALADEGAIDKSLLNSATFSLLYSALPAVLLGYPLIYLFTKKLPAKAPEIKPFKMSHEIILFIIALAVMFAGNFISTMLINNITSGQAENRLVTTVSSLEVLPIIQTVIIAPIVEELIFRKLMLDRVAVYGEKWAIIFGALCFALFHNNPYQLLYTFGMGLILGYVYLKSGRLIYSIILHLGINIIGSLVGPIVINMIDMEAIQELNNLNSQGKQIPQELMNTASSSLLIYGVYVIFMIAVVIAGIVLFIINRKKFRAEKSELLPTAKEGVGVSIANLGMILYIVMSVIMLTIQIVMPIFS